MCVAEISYFCKKTDFLLYKYTVTFFNLIIYHYGF